MDGEKARAVMEAGLTEISFSIDGIDKASYEHERPGAKFEDTMENIRSLLTQMKKARAKNPRVTIQSIVPVGHDLLPPKHVTQLLTGFGFLHYKVLNPHNWRGEVNIGRTRRESIKPNPCMFLWHELSIGWDGRVMGCCADLNGEFIRGDLKEESILDVWNNEKATALREAHANRAPFAHPLCRSCSVPYQKQKVTPLTRLYRQGIKDTVKAVFGMGNGR
jgi:radical SAM protein with 4Fe4S-binding SPASM domain